MGGGEKKGEMRGGEGSEWGENGGGGTLKALRSQILKVPSSAPEASMHEASLGERKGFREGFREDSGGQVAVPHLFQEMTLTSAEWAFTDSAGAVQVRTSQMANDWSVEEEAKTPSSEGLH